MSSAPKDLNLGQSVVTVKDDLSQTQRVVNQGEAELDAVLKTVQDAFPSGSVVSQKAKFFRTALATGDATTTDTIVAIQKLLKEFNIPLALFGGMKLSGSGQMALALHQVLSNTEGLESSMTKSNKVINLWVGYIATAATVIGAIVSVLPSQIQGYALGGGLTVSALALGIGRIAAVLTSRYPDQAPPAKE